MKPYPRYKPTGLAWLPSVPEHWDVRKAKFLIRVGNGSDPKTDGDIPVYGSGAASFKTCGEYKEGPCVLVGRKGATLHIPHYVEGKYWNVDTSFDVKTTSGDYSLRYYYYCATRFDYQYYIAQTTLPGMAKSDYLNMPLPVPPPSEQDRIVRYLDEKTAAIDELVRAKEREIELLRERKQALVSAAVTGGLDPATERKDSGVPWIGKIPKGWNKDKVTRIFSVVGSGTTPESGNMEFYSGATIPWMNSGDLYSGEAYITSTERKVAEAAIQKCSALKLYSGETIVIAMYGASIGNLGIANFSFCANQACCCLSNPRNGFDTKYLFYALSSCKLNWLEASKGGSQPNISQNIIRQTWLPVPSFPEQERIVAHLDSACSELDAAEAAIRKQISLLQELRTRLVSDAVTGAVEVANPSIV